MCVLQCLFLEISLSPFLALLPRISVTVGVRCASPSASVTPLVPDVTAFPGLLDSVSLSVSESPSVSCCPSCPRPLSAVTPSGRPSPLGFPSSPPPPAPGVRGLPLRPAPEARASGSPFPGGRSVTGATGPPRRGAPWALWSSARRQAALGACGDPPLPACPARAAGTSGPGRSEAGRPESLDTDAEAPSPHPAPGRPSRGQHPRPPRRRRGPPSPRGRPARARPGGSPSARSLSGRRPAAVRVPGAGGGPQVPRARPDGGSGAAVGGVERGARGWRGSPASWFLGGRAGCSRVVGKRLEGWGFPRGWSAFLASAGPSSIPSTHPAAVAGIGARGNRTQFELGQEAGGGAAIDYT